MTKIMIIPNNISTLLEEADAYLFGIKDFSVNIGITISIDELKQLILKIKKNNKEIFISLNGNYNNKEIVEIKNILLEIEKLNIDGIFYYDVALVNLKEKYDLKTKLVWAAEHLTTNYATINYWQESNVSYTCLSSEITLKEIIEIKKNTSTNLIVPIFGYLPMFTSKRHAVKNYLETFNIKDKSKIFYLQKEEKTYPIIDNKLGTVMYSSHILNGYNEYLELEKHNIDYILIDSNFIEEKIFKEIVKIYKKKQGEDKIRNLLENIDKGFLYKDTIYQVKKL